MSTLRPVRLHRRRTGCSAPAPPASRCRRSRPRHVRLPSAAKREPEPKRAGRASSRCRTPLAAARPAQAGCQGGRQARRMPHRRPRTACQRPTPRRALEPAKDGYINAIQVYPYHQGRALSGLCRRQPGHRHRARGRREARRRSRPATPCAGWSATRRAARATTRQVHILVKPVAR